MSKWLKTPNTPRLITLGFVVSRRRKAIHSALQRMTLQPEHQHYSDPNLLFGWP